MMDCLRFGDITGFDDAEIIEIIDDEEVNDNDNEQQNV